MKTKEGRRGEGGLGMWEGGNERGIERGGRV